MVLVRKAASVSWCSSVRFCIAIGCVRVSPYHISSIPGHYRTLDTAVLAYFYTLARTPFPRRFFSHGAKYFAASDICPGEVLAAAVALGVPAGIYTAGLLIAINRQ